jgi:tetratricopeptide (TPR) repeat protein
MSHRSPRPLLTLSESGVARRRRLAAIAARSFCAAALVVAWCAVVYANRPAAFFSRAGLAMDADDLERLQYELLGLRDSPAYEAHASLLTAKLMLSEGRPDPALIVLEVAAAHPDTEVRALNLTGEALYRLGRLREAGELWASVLQREPGNAAALRWLGIAYYDLGAMQEAVQYLARAAAVAPADAGPHRLLGLIWKNLGKFSEAIDAFQESLRRKPDQGDAPAVRFELAECHHFLNQDREALKMLDRSAPSADVFTLRAQCEHACGRVEEALKTAEQALDLDHRQIGALLLQATIANEQKQRESAVERWLKVTHVDPCNQEAHYQLAIAYRRMGQGEKAEIERKAAAELDELQQEYQVASEIAATEPNDIDARLRLGTLCERLQKYKTAREWFRAAVYLDPQNQSAREALVRLLQITEPSDAEGRHRSPKGG